MKQRNKPIGLTAFISASVFFALTFAVTFWFYLYTKYVPFLLCSLILGMPALMNIIIALMSWDAKCKRPEKPKRESENADPSAKKVKKKGSVKYAVRVSFFGISSFYNKTRKILKLLLLVAVFVLAQLYFGMTLRKVTSIFVLEYWQPVVLLLLFVGAIIFDKYCKHTESESKFINSLLHNSRLFFYLTKLSLALAIIISMVKLLGFADLQKYSIYIFAAIFYYASVLIVVSIAVLIIKKELEASPKMIIPLPFAGKDSRELGVISFLEKNTGITMRSLWSIKLIKQILPYTVIAVAALLWFSTGIVQVESYQQGAVYRFGKLCDEPLESGLHLTLPYPLDKVEIYSTEVVDKLTIGYISKEDTDNIWTSTHGSNEHKLLLGNGNELVSMNLRVEYKISDLNKYLKNSATPLAFLEARAYELITDRTISTDLETLLSVDRAAFAASYRQELSDNIAEYDIGLEVVSVVLESIHPPLEIAEVYQEIISAEIKAEQQLLAALGEAATKKAQAEIQRDTEVNTALADYYNKLAEANASVAEFMASVEAYGGSGEDYLYYKYLKAITEAYGKANLVIVGEGVDSSKIFFGSFGNKTEE